MENETSMNGFSHNSTNEKPHFPNSLFINFFLANLNLLKRRKKTFRLIDEQQRKREKKERISQQLIELYERKGEHVEKSLMSFLMS